MPEPAGSDQKYLPGLDGLRAIAVAAVVAYHLGYGWAQGGLLGVGVFFTLSGYLITDILVGQWAVRGKIRLGNFWMRRARRLLPALFVMLAVVTLWVNAFARSFIPGFRGNVVASVFYGSNWWYIDQHSSYYARFSPPTPLDHLWSLAVEEQFYLVWPWVVLLMVWVAGRAVKRRRLAAAAAGVAPTPTGGADAMPFLTGRARAVLCAVTLVLAAGSALLMAKLYQPGYDPTRVYEGTDTRACGLLVGAALAMVWPTRRPRGARTVPAAARRALDAAGLAGLVTIAVMIWKTNEYSGFMFHGGLVILSVATAAVLAAAVTPGSQIGKALGVQPLRWLGVRSYGIYLWHYPVIVLTAAAGTVGTPASLGRAVTVVAITLAAAAISWQFVEDPIRRGSRLRWIPSSHHATAAGGISMTNDSGPSGGQQPGSPRRPGVPRTPRAIAGVSVVAAAVLAVGVTTTLRLTSNTASAASTPTASSPASARLSNSDGNQGTAAKPGAKAVKAVSDQADGSGGTQAVSAAAAGSAATVSALPTPPPHTSCTSVVHIGDSTSEGLISADYEPNPANRIPARYADVGIKHSIMKIVGATSVVESLPGTPNAADMAKQVKKDGFNGCWVLALGTNDSADVAVGSNVSATQRVEEMMKIIGNQPVMWVAVTSLLSSGPYSEANMQAWDDAVKAELPKYPNMRIYNWPAVAQKSWFINDGIHYTSLGYAHRATDIADALATAFPAAS
jgi:peptidoglycan/LPS O-acetylase OafA/YrhL